jgi:hypothetical protein
MSTELSPPEAVALSKLVEKLVESNKKAGKVVEPGSSKHTFTVLVDCSMSRAVDTKVTPNFKMADLLKPLLLRYAQTLEDPVDWLQSLLSVDGALGAVIQLGPAAVMETVDPGLVAAWHAMEDAAKAKHKFVATKVPRAGNTSVVGTLQKLPENEYEEADSRP